MTLMFTRMRNGLLAIFTLAACYLVFKNVSGQEVNSGRLRREVPPPQRPQASKQGSKSEILWEKSLLITDLQVVNHKSWACDVYRTKSTPPTCDPQDLGKGPFTFSWAFQQAANSQITNTFIESFKDAQGTGKKVLNTWHSYNQDFALPYAPFRLLAVVFRPDLARDPTSGGEVRLVFCGYEDIQNEGGEDFYAIFEFAVKVANRTEFQAWAQRWADLSKGTGPLAPDKVKALVEEAAANSTRIRLRINKKETLWEFSEFYQSNGAFNMQPLESLPKWGASCEPTLTTWINSNAEFYRSPAPVDLTLGALSTDQFEYGKADHIWAPKGLTDVNLRDEFALSTCNGCHTTETNTDFAHIKRRGPNAEAELSHFLKGNTKRLLKNTTTCEKLDLPERVYNEKQRRLDFLVQVLNGEIQNLEPAPQVH